MIKLILFISFFLTNFCVEILAQKKLDSKVLDTLIKHAELTQSDALVIFLEGKLYSEYYFGKEPKRIEAMSSTKSIVNLAIGKLITDSLIKSIDQPIYDFYPEWKQGQKKEITIRHLMNHTSGVQNIPLTTVEIYPSPDFVKLALAAEITDKPGTKFSYNNKAMNLLAGIVKIASRKRMDNYLAEKIFAPLGIEDYDWTLDDEGNPHAMAGFQVLPKDLAKLGQLFVQKGKWEGKQLINEKWFTETGTPSTLEPSCGLLWWIDYEQKFSIIDDEQIGKLQKAGLPDSVINVVRSLKGKHESSVYSKLFAEKMKRIMPVWDTAITKILKDNGLTISRKENMNKFYKTLGYLGNCMAVYPDKNLVVVRMISEESF